METAQTPANARRDGGVTTGGSKVRFSIARWSAWAPGRTPGEAKPPIPELPMLLRRRVSFADAMALRVAFDCVGLEGAMPAVFCSRIGEVHRSVELLEALTKNEPLSPMTFGFSVHNAAAAMFSIVRGDTSASSALAAGANGLPEGVLEACGMLAEGRPQVLVVAYDDSLPAVFERYADDDNRPAALALLLQPAAQNPFSLELLSSQAPGASPREPQTVSVARFLERGEPELKIVSGPRRWTWRRES